MCNIDDSFTNEQLTELALMQAKNSAQVEKALTAAARQAMAGCVMNALLLRALESVGLVDHDALKVEAFKRAQSIQPPDLGASVAQVIMAIFDGKAPGALSSDLTRVNCSPTDAKH